MASFTMEIAGLAVCVQPLYQSTREYCKSYLTDKDPEFVIKIASGDLMVEQVILEEEAVAEGLKIRKFKEPFLERSAIQRRLADYLLNRNTLMLHASTVSVDGNAYLFTAPCGTGKSTHTRLWCEMFGDRAIMVNDDKPFLEITSSGVLAYGSPWSGKHGLASNVCVPLRGICLLHRGSENFIKRIEPNGILDILYNQAHAPGDACLMQQAHILVDRLAQMIPLWEMDCNKDLEAAKVAYCAMSGVFD